MTLESISVTERSLIFDYTVNNYSPFPVYLFNHLAQPSKSGVIQVAPHQVFSWLTNEGTLSFARQLLIAPGEVAPDRRVVPFVSRLESRWTMSETIRLPMPIELNHPYADTMPGSQMASATQFTFTLGYILGDTTVETEEVPLPEGNLLTRPYYGDAIKRQRLKQSRPVRALIPVSD